MPDELLTDEVRQKAEEIFIPLTNQSLDPTIGFAWCFYESRFLDGRIHISLSRGMRLSEDTELITKLFPALSAVRNEYGQDDMLERYFTMRQLLFPNLKLKRNIFPNFIFFCGGRFYLQSSSESMGLDARKELGLEYTRKLGEAALRINNSPCWFYSDFDFHGIRQESGCWNVDKVRELKF